MMSEKLQEIILADARKFFWRRQGARKKKTPTARKRKKTDGENRRFFVWPYQRRRV